MTVTITPVCAKCGADIREGSMYCYGCGSRIAEASPAIDSMPVAEPSIDEPQVEANEELEKAIAAATSSSAPRQTTRRRQPRPEPKTVEVVWAEPQGSSLVFLLGSGILVLLVVVLVFLALYLK